MKNSTHEKPAGPSEQAGTDFLETTAQAIGSTLGNLAVKTGIAKPQAGEQSAEPHAQSGQPAKNGSPADREHQPANGDQHPNRRARRAKKKK